MTVWVLMFYLRKHEKWEFWKRRWAVCASDLCIFVCSGRAKRERGPLLTHQLSRTSWQKSFNNFLQFPMGHLRCDVILLRLTQYFASCFPQTLNKKNCTDISGSFNQAKQTWKLSVGAAGPHQAATKVLKCKISRLCGLSRIPLFVRTEALTASRPFPALYRLPNFGHYRL